MYVHMYICTYVCMYIYRERDVCVCAHITYIRLEYAMD